MHKWTEEEREIVRRDYRGTKGSAEAIARRLGNGITMVAVRAKAGRLGLGGDRSLHRNGWSPEEKERLGQLITQYAPDTVAKMMGRGVGSVLAKAQRLGYSRRVRDEWFTLKEACEILGVSHGWLRQQIDARHLKASWHYGAEPSRGKGTTYWHITEEDLKAFIQRYPMELTGRNVDLFAIVDILAGVTAPFRNER